THGRGQVQAVELAAARDARLVGLRLQLPAAIGASPGSAPILSFLTRPMTSGADDIPCIHFAATAVVTNISPLSSNPGAARRGAAGPAAACRWGSGSPSTWR